MEFLNNYACFFKQVPNRDRFEFRIHFFLRGISKKYYMYRFYNAQSFTYNLTLFFDIKNIPMIKCITIPLKNPI